MKIQFYDKAYNIKYILNTLFEMFVKSYKGGIVSYIHSILCRFSKYSYELLFHFLSSYDSYLPISTMVGMPEIDILDGKMLALAGI